MKRDGRQSVKKDYTRLIAAIRAFCLMIDYLESYRPEAWLKEMNHLLPQIEAGMQWLDLDIAPGFFALPDLEWRFAMFCRLKAFLGKWDEYPLPGDRRDDPSDFTGSLADDFTDLYFELRRGLNLYDAEGDLASALVLWRTGYVLHWREHLYDACRRLEWLGGRI
nr:hypothetical conserved protein [uncultured Gammaproteobacteria bacterium]BAL54508.1 hypothetical conserved protein [uncultured Gammaproteobacteria bacterium]